VQHSKRPPEVVVRARTVHDMARAVAKTAFQRDDSFIRNCLVCLNFDETTELCKLFQQRPPARVIAFGCDSFKDVDDIPF
jgi:hypothetical protein